MVENIGNVRNPLTVIAVFAGIAEVSGSIVLPFIEEPNQRLYIWFLMLFPTLLVVAFFLTLVFKHQVLYAPSDFRDDTSFTALIRGFSPATSATIQEKIDEEIAAEEGVGSTQSKPTNERSIPPSATPSRSIRADIGPQNVLDRAQLHQEAESLVFQRLEKELGIGFSRRLHAELGGHSFTFDGAAIRPDSIHIVEVRMISNRLSIPRTMKSFRRLRDYFESLSASARKKITFIVVLVLEGEQGLKDVAVESFNNTTKDWGVSVQIRTYELTELRADFRKD